MMASEPDAKGDPAGDGDVLRAAQLEDRHKHAPLVVEVSERATLLVKGLTLDHETYTGTEPRADAAEQAYHHPQHRSRHGGGKYCCGLFDRQRAEGNGDVAPQVQGLGATNGGSSLRASFGAVLRFEQLAVPFWKIRNSIYQCAWCSGGVEGQAATAERAAQQAEELAEQARANEAAVHATLTTAKQRTFEAEAEAYRLRQAADRQCQEPDRPRMGSPRDGE